VHFKREWEDKCGIGSSYSCVSLIDLAGSERASATENVGVRLAEGAKINQSLLALANCISRLAKGSPKEASTILFKDSRRLQVILLLFFTSALKKFTSPKKIIKLTIMNRAELTTRNRRRERNVV
jgi:hypothetical protein